MGEPAGIGTEVTLKAWRNRESGTPAFFLIDDPDRVRRCADRLGWDIPVAAIEGPTDATVRFDNALPVLSHSVPVHPEPGHPSTENGRAVIGAIERAVELVRDGAASAVVTNPIHKRVLYEAGFTHPGHTEFLAALAGTGEPPVMMLACPELRVIPVTVHLPFRAVANALSTETIIACGRIADRDLRLNFGIERPRLAVAGLNPHAGEEGAIGREEIDIIAPAVAQLKAEGIAASGPYPADSLFHPAARADADVVLCMYHDQALIPLKTLDFWGGVNVTLGLPFIRTSPDHGTGFAIAGTGKANEASFVASLAMAADMAAHRHAVLGDG